MSETDDPMYHLECQELAEFFLSFATEGFETFTVHMFHAMTVNPNILTFRNALITAYIVGFRTARGIEKLKELEVTT